MRRELSTCIAIAAALVLGGEKPSRADETAPPQQSQVKEDVDTSHVRVELAPGYAILHSSNGASLSGAMISIGAQYATSTKWAFGLGVSECFKLSGLVALFTQLDFKASFAITGSQLIQRSTTSVGSAQVVKSEPYSTGGWRANAYATDYLLAGSTEVVSYTGLGLGAGYEFASRSGANTFLGLKFEQARSPASTMTAIQGSIGFMFWL